MKYYVRCAVVATTLTLAAALPAFAAVDEPKSAVEQPVQQRFNGTIDTIGPSARMVTVKALLASKTFILADDARIVIKNKPDAQLADLKAGDEVAVLYTAEGDILTAHRVEVTAGATGTETK